MLHNGKLFSKYISFTQKVSALKQEIGKEILFYNSDSNEAHALDETSSQIYRLCEKSVNFETLHRQFSDSPEELEARLAALLDHGLIEIEETNSLPQAPRREFLKTAAKIGVLSVMLPIPAAAASCASSANTCDDAGATPLCTSCNPAGGCNGIVVKQFKAYSTGDLAGGSLCGVPGVNTLSVCDGTNHAVNADCNTAKKEGDNGGNYTYYCCSTTPATCTSIAQCASGIGTNTACCTGGICTPGGTCM